MFSNYIKLLEDDFWKKTETHFGNTKEAVTMGDFETGNIKIGYLNFLMLRILSFKIDELERSISEVKDELGMESFKDLAEYVFDYSKHSDCEHCQEEMMRQIKYYYYDLNLNFKEIKKVKDLIKDVKESKEIEIANVFYGFYGKYKDFTKLSQLTNFVKSFDLTNVGGTEYEDELIDIVEFISVKGIDALEKYKNMAWGEMTDNIYKVLVGR